MITLTDDDRTGYLFKTVRMILTGRDAHKGAKAVLLTKLVHIPAEFLYCLFLFFCNHFSKILNVNNYMLKSQNLFFDTGCTLFPPNPFLPPLEGHPHQIPPPYGRTADGVHSTVITASRLPLPLQTGQSRFTRSPISSSPQNHRLPLQQLHT